MALWEPQASSPPGPVACRVDSASFTRTPFISHTLEPVRNFRARNTFSGSLFRILPFRRHGAHPIATLPGPPCRRHPGRFVHTQGRRLRLTPETGEATGRVCRDVGTVRVRCSGPPRRSGRFRVAGLNAAARASEGVPSLSPALAVVFRGDRTQDPGMPGQSGGESRAGRGANPAAIVRDAVVTAHRSEAL